MFPAALLFACRRAVLWLAIVLALALSSALPAHASAATRAVCSSQEQAARAIALRVYSSQMKAERAAFFRSHASPRARQAFVNGQRKKRNSLRAAVRACKLASGVAEGASDPPTAPCSPTLFSAPYTEMNEGTTHSVLPLRPNGRIRAVMLFVDFPGLPASESMSALYDRMVPAARQWITEVSYDRVRLDVAPSRRWHRMPNQIGAYGLTDGISWDEHAEYIGDAVRAADSEVDFSQYDVVYVVAPKGSGIERSPAFQAYAGSGIEADGNELRFGATFFEDTRSSAEYAANVLIHETGHILGLPDLYDVPNPNPDYWSLFRFAGGWDVMSWNDPGTHVLAWNKWKLGWLDSSQLTCLDGPGELTTTITPLARQGGLKAVVLRMGPSSAYVVEARRKIGEDSGLCETGVLVYSVDSTTRSGNGPVRVRTAQQDTSSALVNRCGPLYNAPFDKAQGEVATFEDANAGLSVRVLSSGTSGYRVQVTRTSLSTNAVPVGSSSPSPGERTVGEGSLAPPLQLLPAPFLFGIGWDLSGHPHEH